MFCQVVFLCCFVVSFFKSEAMKIEQFDSWKCSSICTDPELRKHLTRICLKLRKSNNLSNGFDEKQIRNRVTCENDVQIQVENQPGYTWFPGTVGKCVLRTDVTKCVTKGPTSNTLFVYDHVNRENACINAKQINYDFNAGKGFWGSVVSLFRKYCLGKPDSDYDF